MRIAAKYNKESNTLTVDGKIDSGGTAKKIPSKKLK
jgi:hypothetical protein